MTYAIVAAVMWTGERPWTRALGWTTLASLLLVRDRRPRHAQRPQRQRV